MIKRSPRTAITSPAAPTTSWKSTASGPAGGTPRVRPHRPQSYDSERLQLAAYCLLVEEHLGRPVRRGRLEYRNHTLDIPFDAALRAALHETLRAIQHQRHAPDVRRSHSNPNRCRACGFRARCADAL